MNEEQEVAEAVNRINEELEEMYKGNYDNLPELYYLKSPSFIAVEMMIPNQEKIWLWNSELSNRKYNEKTNEYESMYTYIKRIFREYKKTINNIKL